MQNYHINCPKLSLLLTLLAIASFHRQLQASDHVNKPLSLVSSIECNDLDLSAVIICDSVQIQLIDRIKKQSTYLGSTEPNNTYASDPSDDYQES